MALKYVLFDLDGTLLPMDHKTFMKAYFGALARRLAARGYDPQELIDVIWKGTAAMVQGCEGKTNEQVFWDKFAEYYGEKAITDQQYFDEYYVEEFDNAQAVCGFTPKAAETIALCKSLGLRVALATNPFFPQIATRKRIAWAGLSPSDFEVFTTYEDSYSCKPNTRYFEEVMERIGAKVEECMMVGNDVTEDMAAAKLGMRVFLLTDCIINKNNEDISIYPHGGFDELMAYIREQAK